MCKILDVSRAGYYSWLNRPKSKRQTFHEQVDAEISTVYVKHKGRYGAPRIHKELAAKDITCSKNVVARRMKSMGLKAKNKRKFKVTTDSSHNLPFAKNILDRNFTTTSINQKWVGDITYIYTDEGWLYLAVVIDLYSRSVIGWSMSKRINKELVCNALIMALWRRGFPKGVIMHTDRGSQYCSLKYQSIIKNYGLICSMSRKGNCWDNSVAESFFKTIKSEFIYDMKFSTRKAAKLAVFDYIEVYYNRERRHSAIDYSTPYEVECNLLNVA